MNMSFKKFKDKFCDHLLNLHWQHWSALGVSSHVKYAGKYALDLEALAVSTLTIGKADKRLLQVSLGWLHENRQRVNVYRLKRISNLFARSEVFRGQPLISESLKEVYEHFINDPESAFADSIYQTGHLENEVAEYIDLFKGAAPRDVLSTPDIRDCRLLQLSLRSLFGTNARADLFLFFLCGRKGNSNSISRDVHLGQRNANSIVNEWFETNIIAEDEASSPDYFMKNRGSWMEALGLDELPVYINWTEVFLFLDHLFVGLDQEHLQSDKYLASSFFRDISDKARYSAVITGVELPSMRSLSGDSYFEPFVDCALNILEKLSL